MDHATDIQDLITSFLCGSGSEQQKMQLRLLQSQYIKDKNFNNKKYLKVFWIKNGRNHMHIVVQFQKNCFYDFIKYMMRTMVGTTSCST
jgi:hypothetical protein